MRSLRRTLFTGLVAVLALGLLASMAAADTSGTAPTIESVSVLGITEHDATLEAQIDPGGLATTYEIWLEYGCPIEPGESSCAWRMAKSIERGQIGADSSTQTVSADLRLEPSQLYGYWVVAINSAGETVSRAGSFYTP